jgi:hypothetical protein
MEREKMLIQFMKAINHKVTRAKKEKNKVLSIRMHLKIIIRNDCYSNEPIYTFGPNSMNKIRVKFIFKQDDHMPLRNILCRILSPHYVKTLYPDAIPKAIARHT